MVDIGIVETVDQLKSKVQSLRTSSESRQIELLILIVEYLSGIITGKADKETAEAKKREKEKLMLENERYVEQANKKSMEAKNDSERSERARR